MLYFELMEGRVQFTAADLQRAIADSEYGVINITVTPNGDAVLGSRWDHNLTGRGNLNSTIEITVIGGVVSHAPSRRQASFGELAADASRLPVPEDVKLKDPARFTLIGRGHLPRLDSRDKSTGKERYAIDVMLPGMMTAVVMRPPRFGGKVASFDASKAKAVPGVVDVVEIPRGVADHLLLFGEDHR